MEKDILTLTPPGEVELSDLVPSLVVGETYYFVLLNADDVKPSIISGKFLGQAVPHPTTPFPPGSFAGNFNEFRFIKAGEDKDGRAVDRDVLENTAFNPFRNIFIVSNVRAQMLNHLPVYAPAPVAVRTNFLAAGVRLYGRPLAETALTTFVRERRIRQNNENLGIAMGSSTPGPNRVSQVRENMDYLRGQVRLQAASTPEPSAPPRFLTHLQQMPSPVLDRIGDYVGRKGGFRRRTRRGKKRRRSRSRLY
jgi:hypothetical protein